MCRAVYSLRSLVGGVLLLGVLFFMPGWSLGQVLASIGEDTGGSPTRVNTRTFRFRNINRLPEYRNETKLREIAELEVGRDWDKLYPKLWDYVSKFGIRNFYKDTPLIWKMAKAAEFFGNRDQAYFFYRLALRHSHEGIDMAEIEIYYDSLNDVPIGQFVPTDYYELIGHRQYIDTLRPARGTFLNMGPGINSRYADYGPTLSYSDNILLFTSKRNGHMFDLKRDRNEDIFVSYRNENGDWNEAFAMEDINSPLNEGSARFSVDGKTLYFTRCEGYDTMGDCDIYESHKEENGSWGFVTNLGPDINSVSWDSQPSLSQTGDTLFFASDRLGGFGLSDIYYAVRRAGSAWSAAKNLGPIINTRKNEVSPFYHPLHRVIYFSSDGQLYSFGEYDIFKSRWVDGAWEDPKNIGPLVNGRGSEFYFTIDSRSENLYYARSSPDNLGRMNLYSFPLPMEGQPEATTTVSGSLTDKLTSEPLRGIVSIIDLDYGVEVSAKFLNPDGTFEFDLIEGRKYLFVVQGDEFFRIEEIFFLDGPLEIHKTTRPIAALVKFNSINFDMLDSQLKPIMYPDLDKVVDFLYDNPDFRLRIFGHTDSSGSEELNLSLSKDRASNIRDYIVIMSGIHETRVEWDGFGSTRLLVEEKTEEDRILNRRVEFEIFRE